jgi:hypothetical protein
MDAAGKMLVKCVKEPGKKKAEASKIVVSWAKTRTKQMSDTEVASVKLVKPSKKAVPNLTMAPAMMCVSARASGSKGAAGGVKEATTPVSKCVSLHRACWQSIFWQNHMNCHLMTRFLETCCPRLCQDRSARLRYRLSRCQHQWGFDFGLCCIYRRRLLNYFLRV